MDRGKRCSKCACVLLSVYLSGDELCEHCGDYDKQTDLEAAERMRQFGSYRPCRGLASLAETEEKATREFMRRGAS